MQTLQAIATATLAAWMAVRTRQMDATTKKAEIQAATEKKRCDELQRLVKQLQRNTVKRKPPKKGR